MLVAVCPSTTTTTNNNNNNNFCNNLFVIYRNCCLIKEKLIYFPRLCKPWISDAIIISNYFVSIRMALLPLIVIIVLKTIKQLLYYSTHARTNYFQRKFTECSNNSSDTWKTLNSLIRCKKTSKDVILNQNGSSVSDLTVIAKVFNNFFERCLQSLIAIFLTKIYLHSISWEHLWKMNFSSLPLIVNLIRRQKNKSTDLMNIPVFIYNISATLISHTVLILFNNPVPEGVFPECCSS